MLFGSEKARAVYYVGFAFDQWLEQHRILGGIVFQVGILHEHEIPDRIRKSKLQRCALSAVPRLKKNADVVVAVEPGEHIASPIRRPIVDNDDLFWNVYRLNAADKLLDCRCFVIDWDYDRKLHRDFALAVNDILV